MRTTPYSEGDIKGAKICFVAEAPAKWEMLKGRPLVGESGQVFDECIHAAGLVRSQCYIANVCRERIPSIDHLVTGAGLTQAGRDAQRDLLQRLEGLGTNVIVPLGNLALACLTDQYGKDRGISRLRGSIYQSHVLPKKVLPTLHPAGTLRGRGPYVNRYVIIADIRKAIREAEYPEVRRVNRQYLIRPSFEDAVDYLRSLRQAEWNCWDIEVANFQVSCIGFCASPTVGMCIPFTMGGTAHYWTEQQELFIWREIAATLGDHRTTKITHYGMFDESFILRTNRVRVRGKKVDTLVAHRIVYPDLPSKLEFLCSMFSDIPYYKDDKKLWSRIGADPDRFYRYNINDVFATSDSAEPLLDIIARDEYYTWTYNNTMSQWEPCLFAMERGVKLDLEALERAKVETKAKIAEKEAELKAVSEVEFNPASPKQVINYFYTIKRIPPYKSRQTGQPTCDDNALIRIIRKYNLPEARLLQEIRALHKLQDTYLDVAYDKDGRMRTFYDIRGATTGRFSSKKTLTGTGLNFQNLHPSFLRFIIPG